MSVQVADDVYKPLRHQFQFQCRGNTRITDRGSELVTYFLLAGDHHQLPPLSPGGGPRDQRRPMTTSPGMTSHGMMTSSVLPCVVQSCGAPARGLFRSSSSRDGQGHAQGHAVLAGRVSMTPPSSLGRHRQHQQGQVMSSADPWLISEQPVRRLAAPPSSLTVPVAGEWLQSGAGGGGRSPDLPLVHYCNANIASRDASCIHLRGVSESSVLTGTPTSPPVQPPRRRLSSSGDASPSFTPGVTQPGWSPALRDGVVLQGKALQQIRESPDELGGASRREPPPPVVDSDTDGGPYDIDAIMRELAGDVERIVSSQPPSSSRLVNQSVQTSNLTPATSSSSSAAYHHHHHHHLALTRAGDRTAHLLPPSPSSGEHVDPRLRWTASNQPVAAVTSTGVLSQQGPGPAFVQYTPVQRQLLRPTNLVQLNGVIGNNFVAPLNDNSRRFVGAVDSGARTGLAANNHQTQARISPPPLPPPPTTSGQGGHPALLQHGGHAASAFKPVSSVSNGRPIGGLQLLTTKNAVDRSAFLARPVAELKVDPAPAVKRRGADMSRPALLGPAPSFRVRRSVCVPSLPRLCRSLENVASDVDDGGPRSGTSSRADSPAALPPAGSRHPQRRGIDGRHQLFLLHPPPDDLSLSSFDGTASEISRSDPALSSYGGETSEYDNYRPGMASDEDYFVPEPISDVDIDLFDDVDIDDVQVSDTYAALDSVAIPPHPQFRRRVVDDV